MARYFIANWKMNQTDKSVKSFISLFGKKYRRVHSGDRVILCPSFVSLASASAGIKKFKTLSLGAQDVFWKEAGNFTGEVSPLRLKKFGVSYCIVGHSERRAMGETDAMVNKKVKALVKVGITPILCIGESKKERNSGKTSTRLTQQLRKGLEGSIKGKRLIIAYEPIWAISKKGKGSAMSSSIIEKEMRFIRATMVAHGTSKKFDSITYIYGGSASSKNIRSIMSIPLVNGVLVGSASLKPASFLRMSTLPV